MVVSAGERTGDYDHSLASLVNAQRRREGARLTHEFGYSTNNSSYSLLQ